MLVLFYRIKTKKAIARALTLNYGLINSLLFLLKT
nr:MAG TPA: hypothetical protein [Caudoviricetes sp.]